MYRKFVLGLGLIAITCSLAMPVERADLTPSSDGSIIFTWNSDYNAPVTDITATIGRTIAIASGVLLVALAIPEKQRRD